MNAALKKGHGMALWTARVVLSAVFLYAGAAKICGSQQAFAESVASFRLLPEWSITPVVLALPPMEICAAVLALTGGLWRRYGAFGLLAMLLLFTLALTSALVRGLRVDCGCLGGDHFDALSPTGNLWIALGRDLVLGAAAWILYADARSQATPPPRP